MTAKAKKEPEPGSAAWWKLQPKVVRPLWSADTELWCVPVRFWEDDYLPERCRVVTDDGKHSYDGSYNVYAFHYEWNHNAYLDPFDLYPSLEECNAEIQRRRRVREAEHEADAEKMCAAMDAVKDSKEPHARVRAGLKAVQDAWAEGDKHDPRRFRDTQRWSK